VGIMAITFKQFTDERLRIAREVFANCWIFGKQTLEIDWIGKGTCDYKPKDAK